jgi:large subunit ribosomal protein L5
MQSLKEKYNKEVVPAMMKNLGYKNVMAVPSIKKVVINSSFGKNVVGKSGSEREKIQNLISQDLSLIAGQATNLVKSKKSIAGFKLREGLEIAAVVTLRKSKMWDLLERLQRT